MYDLRMTYRFIAAAAVAALAAGCGSDASTAPTSNQSLDLTAIFAQMAAGNIQSVPGASVIADVPPNGATPALTPTGCTYASATQNFICPSSTVSGLTMTASYVLYDAAGHPQAQADAATTDAVRLVTDVHGTTVASLDGSTTTDSLDNHNDETLKGLLHGPRTLTGTATVHNDVTTTGAIALHDVLDGTTTANLVLPANATGVSGTAWPLSGTITSDVTSLSTLFGTPTPMTVHAVLTYNGTSVVTITMTEPGSTLTETCTIDLTGATAPVCSGQ